MQGLDYCGDFPRTLSLQSCVKCGGKITGAHKTEGALTITHH